MAASFEIAHLFSELTTAFSRFSRAQWSLEKLWKDSQWGDNEFTVPHFNSLASQCALENRWPDLSDSLSFAGLTSCCAVASLATIVCGTSLVTAMPPWVSADELPIDVPPLFNLRSAAFSCDRQIQRWHHLLARWHAVRRTRFRRSQGKRFWRLGALTVVICAGRCGFRCWSQC